MELQAFTGLATAVTNSRAILKQLKQSKLADEHRTLVDQALDLVSDLGDRMLAIQTTQIQLQQEIASLTSKLAAADDWKQRLAGYELHQTNVGGFVLRSKNSNPPHFACPNCAEVKQRIVILQDEGEYAGTHGCRVCDTHYATSEPREPDFHAFT
jgi:hypothetical protein